MLLCGTSFLRSCSRASPFVPAFGDVRSRTLSRPASLIPASAQQHSRFFASTALRFPGGTNRSRPEFVSLAPAPILRPKIPSSFFNTDGMAAWACKECTFLNLPLNASCEMCGTPNLKACSEIATDHAEWTCAVCTLVNGSPTAVCEACGSSTPSIPLVGNNEAAASEISPRHVALHSPSFAASFDEWLPPGGVSARKRGPSADVSKPEVAEKRIRLTSADGDDQADQPRSSSNALLADLHANRLARQQAGAVTKDESHQVRTIPSSKAKAKAGQVTTTEEETKERLVILTYNVWFQDVQLQARIAAIAAIIQEHKPDVICLQEVTPVIYRLFQQNPWWSKYKCSVPPQQANARPYYTMQLSRLPVLRLTSKPFQNSIMDRELCSLSLSNGFSTGLIPGARLLTVATTHLESPCPSPPTWDQMFSKERVGQAREALERLRDAPNVVFCGDMNWDDGKDGEPPLPLGWGDAWCTLHPAEPGYTYDAKANGMLTGNLRKRLDRVFYKLEDYNLEGIRMIGTEAIPGLTYKKERSIKKVKTLVDMPVFPSDHFGLLVTICRKR